MTLFTKFRSALSKTGDSLRRALGRPVFDAKSLADLEATLLAADFGPAVTADILAEIKRQAGKGDITVIAKQIIELTLSKTSTPLHHSTTPSLQVILLVGVNGTGKTTTAARLAHHYKLQGKTVLLAACDTFRAAAIDQLKIWGQRVGCEVVARDAGADAAAVAHDAVAAAVAKKSEVLILDTAGRQHTKSNLMTELQKIHRVLGKVQPGAPHETLLVLDATTGMNALTQAREFHKAVPLTGLIVCKLDGTAKGGIVVAIARELNLPVRFIGLGEQLDDLQPFDAKEFAKALFE